MLYYKNVSSNMIEAIEEADIVTFWIPHKEFKNLNIKTTLDFCKVIR